MDDDRKDRPGGRGPRKDGPRNDSPRRDGPRKDGPSKAGPGGKPAGERKFSRPMRSESDGPAGDRKPWRGKPRQDGDRLEDRPRRPRPADDSGGERPKRQWRPEGERSAATDEERRFSRPPRRDGDAPSGDRKPYRGKPRDEAGQSGERAPGGFREKRPFGDRKSFGDNKPFRERKPFTGDAAGARGEKREWKRPDGERSFGDKKPFRERKPFDGKPFEGKRSRDGDRPRDRFGEGKPAGSRFDGPRPQRGTDRAVRDEAAPEEGERIAKRLARAGISSRRDAEDMIASGRVKVNGKVLSSPAVNVGPDDLIQVDNETIPAIERTRVFVFHKPGGVVTTNRDPEGRKTVFDVLPQGLPRLLTVGRLDINTEGLMLLTNDGGLARVLELPSTGWLRRYRARVHGRVDENRLRELKDGIAVDGVFYGAIEATLDREQGSNAWLTLGLREGKNREVKNVLGALGLDVSRLIRVSFGPFQLGELAEGEVQELRGRLLRDQLGERLIEEAGANFEAPVLTEFSNQPVAAPRREYGDRAERGDAPPRRERKMEVGEGGLIKNRKRIRDDRRDDALGRLQTSRPPMKGKSGPGRKKDEKPFEAPRPRTANVWMAPGARPQGKKPVESEGSLRDEPRRERPNRERPAGDRPRSDRPRSDRPQSDRPRGDRPSRDGAPKPRPSRGPKR